MIKSPLSTYNHTLFLRFVFFVSFTLSHFMELSAIDITKEVRACHRCEKKWADDNAANHEYWQTVEARGTGKVVLICGRCVDHYQEKKIHSERIYYCLFPPTTYTFAEATEDASLSSRTTGQPLPVQRLIADSQWGIGMCLTGGNMQY